MPLGGEENVWVGSENNRHGGVYFGVRGFRSYAHSDLRRICHVVDPATIVTALQDAGYKAKLSKNDDGDPLIESASQGNVVQISLLNCQDHRRCDQLEFVTLWSCAPDDLKRCQVLNNKWNGTENFSSTIIVGDNIALYKHILFDEIGISSGLFIKNMEMFAGDAGRLMAQF